MSNIERSIVQALGAKKDAFLNSIENAIYSHISSKSVSDCLSVVTKNTIEEKGIKWVPSELFDGYGGRFIAFLRKKTYKGKLVDSYLTDGVVNVVTREYGKLYSNNSQIISDAVMTAMLSDKVILNALSQQVVETVNGTLPTVAKQKLSDCLIHNIEQSMGVNITNAAGHAVTVATTHIISAATAIPITKAMLAVLGKSIAVFMKGAIAKVLASTAVKSMLTMAIKKMVAVKIVGTLLAMIGAHFGGISIGWVLLPAIVAYLLYSVVSLPQKLGEKVSQAVREELSGQYDSINQNIAKQISFSVASSLASVFARDIANADEVKQLLGQFNN